ncbi:MAG TPA: N-6 DNA methylase [Candidatus Acidoferrales bacterium]|nr:N-6 DNA methylase [Candidatus Acidoferrales bacterium]
MQPLADPISSRRYQSVTPEKAGGATYTPESLARFVGERISENAELVGRTSLTILDPAIGDGALVLALLDALQTKTQAAISIRGFDTNISALNDASQRIRTAYPSASLELTQGNFLDFVVRNGRGAAPSLFAPTERQAFDLIIANPPYVRTQIMGSDQAQRLAATFGLSGRVDLYQAFLLGITQMLADDGTAGIIVSNRFMTTKGGGVLRSALREHFKLQHVWDLGDTKLFGAAVLPAVISARGRAAPCTEPPLFTSIYEAKEVASARAPDPISALRHEGIVEVADGRRFVVRHGTLADSGSDDDVWRISSRTSDQWLSTVDYHTWKCFGEIGKIRVGVKTCADKVFIRHDWDSAFGNEKPELLRPLMTHHVSGRFRAVPSKKVREILYPHEVVQGQRKASPLERFPKSRTYLESHRPALESRSYVLAAGRRWYELWVPQDPEAWSLPKLVFRDISERPTFWIDLDGSIVNGDCYWMVSDRADNTDLLWLAAAVANSTFAEAFYDHRFNNKLYAGRRRFITQYVEQFPLPDPVSPLSRDIVARAKALYAADHAPEAATMESELDDLIWRVFGLRVEEVSR